MRILIAALIGGIVMFVWGAVAHMALGLGNPGIHPPAHEDVVLSSLHQGLGNEPGVYILPWLDPNSMLSRLTGPRPAPHRMPGWSTCRKGRT